MLQQLIRDLVSVGRVTLTVGHDSPVVVDSIPRGAPNLDVAIRIRDHRTAMAIAADPDLQLGEAYMDDRLTIERGTLCDFMEIIGRNIGRRPAARLFTVARRAVGRLLAGSNTLAKAKANVEHHYDLSNDFYRLFLDRDMQYSCAYFTKENQSLEAAQAAKKAHIIAKLDLHDGCQVLDIGCGWGGLPLSIARAADIDAVPLTRDYLSGEETRIARRLAARVARPATMNRAKAESC